MLFCIFDFSLVQSAPDELGIDRRKLEEDLRKNWYVVMWKKNHLLEVILWDFHRW